MSVCKHGIAFSECKDCYQPESEPLPVRPESTGSVFTIADIKEWLDGWRLFTGSGKEHTSGNQAINYALTFLEDEEDGIEAFVGQMKGLQNEE